MTRYTVDESGCWIWQGPLWPNGYGLMNVKRHDSTLAHRAFYIEHRGAVPDGMDLDHLCRVRECVNPEHLEPVSRATNLTRGHEARTICENSLHDITVAGALKPGTRECVECWRARYRAAGRRYRDRKRQALSPGA